LCLTQEYGTWTLREIGSAQGKGVRDEQAPQTRREISSQLPARKEAKEQEEEGKKSQA
jgi:hypothetical protein